jgi:predicted metal-dependent phosphoesterase TrpH
LPLPVRRPAVLAAALLALGSPAAAQYTLYYGNMHSHCTLSDDALNPPSGPPATAFAYARDTAGIDVLALTDHSHYLSASEYNTLKTEADNFTQNGVFVAIAAQEHGNLSTSTPGSFGHMNIYEAANILNQATLREDLQASYAYIAANVNRINGQPLIGSFNHPYSGSGEGANAQFADFAWDATGDDAMEFIEVINGKRTAAYEAEYFAALALGWRIGALGNQDNHDGLWGDQPNNVNNIPLTGIWAPALTKGDILNALAARRTFAMEVEPVTDRISLTFTADGNWMGTEYSTAADSIEFFVDVSAATNIGSIALYRNGTLIRQTGGTGVSTQWTVHDTPGPGSFWYLVKVTQSDGDRAWSSPVWIESTSNFSLPIATVNQDDGSGLPTMWFQTATVQGIVTVDTDTLSTVDNEVYIQDATGGLMVLQFGGQSVPVQLGDNVLVTGTVDTFQGQTMISGPSITIQSTGGGEPPAPLITTNDIATNGEAWEGSLVELHYVSITGGTWPAPGVNGSVTIDDGSGPATLLIDKDTVLDNLGAPGQATFAVKGIVTQRDASPPFTCCYVILPRFGSDIFQLTPTGVVELPIHHSVELTSLSAPSPNPFEFGTKLAFELAGTREQPVSFAVYDVHGRKVRTIVDGPLAPGAFEVDWDGRSDQGGTVSAGVYFVRLVAGDVNLSRKIVRLN